MVTLSGALVPPAPLHVSVYVAVLASAAVDSLPEAGFAPLQAPEAVHEVALVEDHDSIDVPLTVTDRGEALKFTVGRGGGGGFALTVTVTERPTDPPAPVQVRLNVALALMTGDCSEPDAALLPAHAPPALQPVAFCAFQARVEREPACTDVGVALNDNVGAGRIPTLTERCVVPPAPVHDRL
jgi:hypothetical protein